MSVPDERVSSATREKMMSSVLSITMLALPALLHPHSATASIVYDDFTSYNTSVWEYADNVMGTTVRGC